MKDVLNSTPALKG